MIIITIISIIIIPMNPTSVSGVSLTNFRKKSSLWTHPIVWVPDKSTKEISLPMSKTKRCLKHGLMTIFSSSAQAVDTERNDWPKNGWISNPHSPWTLNFIVAWQQVIFPGMDWSWQVPSCRSTNATPEVLKSQWVYFQVHQWLFFTRWHNSVGKSKQQAAIWENSGVHSTLGFTFGMQLLFTV